jgi:hypothetical protein
MQEVVSTPLPQTELPKKKKFPTLIVAVVLILIVIGFFIFRSLQSSGQTEITPTPTQEPSPTEKPQIDKSKVRIQVVNGTGTPGQAGTTVAALKEAGYNEDLIETGNADEFSSTPTTITAREGFEDAANDIKEVLSKTFDTITIDSSKLDEGGQFDIIIVTGGEEFEEPTSTPAPTSTAASPTPQGATPTPTRTPTPTP